MFFAELAIHLTLSLHLGLLLDSPAAGDSATDDPKCDDLLPE